jgi:hAT family C-terminal dimerisation region
MKQSTIKGQKEVLTTTRVEQIKEALAEAVYIDGLPEMRFSNEDVHDYWNSRLLSQPDLARFALDMLALPASSAECGIF